ncbi:MAG: FAD-dependent oxidoreductase [Pseudomonadota bacterium]
MAGRVLIAGGGIAGLTAALALARRGFEVELVERAELFGEIGAGIQLGPNAMRVMEALGLAEPVVTAGFRPRCAEIRLGDLGHQVFSLSFDGTAPPGRAFVQIHRADLHALLLAAARDAGAVLTGSAQAVSVAQSEARVTLTLADGTTRDAEFLIGADGLRSAIQPHVVTAPPPRFTGQVAWRATLAAEDLPDGLVAPNGTIWVGPGRHVVTYFLRGGALVNIVAVEERTHWQEEGWTTPGDPDALRAAFAGWHPRVTGLLDRIDTAYIWALRDRPPLPVWTKGRVALIGDACHPMLPFLAQGAAMAIEDGWVLAAALARNPGPEGLARYAAARQARTARVQHAARRNAGRFHRRGALGRLAEFGPMAVANLVMPWTLRRAMRWLYDHDATQSIGS